MKMPAGELILNPNEPNPGFMVYHDEARKIILQTIASKPLQHHLDTNAKCPRAGRCRRLVGNWN